MKIEPDTIYQCPKTQECQNLQCFWKQRDCMGLQPFPVWFDENGNCPSIESNTKIQEEFGGSYFPKHYVSVGTNCMYVICEDFEGVDKSSFDLVVTERIQTQPEFRKEILREVIEHISSDDLLVAKKMLDQVIEADEGVDK